MIPGVVMIQCLISVKNVYLKSMSGKNHKHRAPVGGTHFAGKSLRVNIK